VSVIEIIRAAHRFVTRTEGIETFHSFSFGAHYDPANTGFGPLIAHNDENLGPGAGFTEHPHRDCEILTWVVEGALEHRDSSGRRERLTAGMAQWQGAGRGIVHAEVNASDTEPLRFIQVWLTPDDYGLDPGYASAAIELPPDRLVLVASGGGPGTGAGTWTETGTEGDAALPMLRQRRASCYAARLRTGAALTLPVATYVHVFVVDGSIAFDGDTLGRGDAARLTDAASARCITALADTDLLIWAMTATTG
jgi:quercetin 2,3-dioxygenase